VPSITSLSIKLSRPVSIKFYEEPTKYTIRGCDRPFFSLRFTSGISFNADWRRSSKRGALLQLQGYGEVFLPVALAGLAIHDFNVDHRAATNFPRMESKRSFRAFTQIDRLFLPPHSPLPFGKVFSNKTWV